MGGREEPGKIFVGGLSWDTDQDSLQGYFGQFGEITDCIVMMNPQTSKSRGFGFVSFKDPSTVQVILSSKNHVIDGRTVDAKACNARGTTPKTQNKFGGGGMTGRTTKIFIGGLPNNVGEDTIRDAFSRFGNVTEVVIMYDHEKGRSRGFGFLTFDNEDSVEQACGEHYVDVNGKQVECKKAEPRGAGGRGGGSAGRGGGRGGGNQGGYGGGPQGGWGQGQGGPQGNWNQGWGNQDSGYNQQQSWGNQGQGWGNQGGYNGWQGEGLYVLPAETPGYVPSVRVVSSPPSVPNMSVGDGGSNKTDPCSGTPLSGPGGPQGMGGPPGMGGPQGMGGGPQGMGGGPQGMGGGPQGMGSPQGGPQGMGSPQGGPQGMGGYGGYGQYGQQGGQGGGQQNMNYGGGYGQYQQQGSGGYGENQQGSGGYSGQQGGYNGQQGGYGGSQPNQGGGNQGMGGGYQQRQAPGNTGSGGGGRGSGSQNYHPYSR